MQLSSRHILLFLIMLGMGLFGYGQKRSGAKIANLGGFDKRPYHFGVQLSANNADFFIEKTFDPSFSDSLITLNHVRQPGFNIAIIGSLHLNKNWTLRLVPGISPKERKLEYTFLNDRGQEELYEKVVSSFYIDVPLLLKYRTDRINNFAAYVIGGATVSRDMASQEKVNNETASIEDQVVKIKRMDYLINVGGGVDFFLPYFKFGIDLRMGYGLNNIHIKENTIFSQPIQSLRSRNFVLSFTFEG